VILLKIQASIFLRRGLKGILKVAEYLSDTHKEICPMVGMGFFELVVWVFVDDFEDIFQIIEKIRACQIRDIFNDFAIEHKKESFAFR
jgi:chlorite dismutase